jgi:hypothetical protein
LALRTPKACAEIAARCLEPAGLDKKVIGTFLRRAASARRSAKKLTIDQAPVVTVTGKAFFDVGHSLKDQKSNRSSHLLGYAAWEIHPVMKLDVL